MSALPKYGKVNIHLTDARAYYRNASDHHGKNRVTRTIGYDIYTRTTRPNRYGRPYTPHSVHLQLWREHDGTVWHLSERQTILSGTRPARRAGRFKHETEPLTATWSSPPPAWVAELVAIEMTQP